MLCPYMIVGFVCAAHAEQSRRVLQFATDDVKRIVLEPQVNEVTGQAGRLRELQAEIDRLRKELVSPLGVQPGHLHL